MAYTDLSSAFGFGSILTSTQMQQLRDNIPALAAGDSGAPEIVTAALDQTASSEAVTKATIRDDAVGQNQIDISLQQNAVTVSTNIAFTGSSYTLGWAASLSGIVAWSILPYETGTNIWGIRLEEGAGAETCYFQARYINATKPWNYGDGEIPLIVEIQIDNLTNKIERISSAQDPIFAHNGPKGSKAHFYHNKMPYRKELVLPPELEVVLPDDAPFDLKIEQKAAIAQIRNQANKKLKQELDDLPKGKGYMDVPVSTGYEFVELTQSMKNRNMKAIPHSFFGNNLIGKTVILLDPVSPLMEDLLAIHESEDEDDNITSLIMDGYFKIDNSELGRARPNGVMSCDFKWKNTP
jgi:hypothetical protein